MTPAEIVEFHQLERARLERSDMPVSVSQIFERAIERYSDRPLWHSIETGERLTYREFAQRAYACAAALEALGVRHGSHVGVMLPNVPAFAVSWIAIALLGAVLIPVNTTYTAAEIAGIVTEGDIEFLIADSAFLGTVEKVMEELTFPPDHILVHGEADDHCRHCWNGDATGHGLAPRRPAEVDENDLLSILFTSGTTGRPKGCMLTHAYWATIAMVRTWQGPAFERILIDRPMYYMGGQYRFLTAMLLGAEAVVASKPTLKHMIDRLLQFDIDFCTFSPLLAKEPIHPRTAELRLKWGATMAIPPSLHAELEKRMNGAPLREMYGLTETGAVLEMPTYANAMTGSGRLGLEAPFRSCRIVGADGRDAGEEGGELWVRGRGMMTGYYKRPDATREAFIDGWFRTGDLFRRDGDGFYTLVGRLKDVIRRSGENISPAEIENLILTLPGIADVAVIGVPDADRGEEVKAYVQIQEGIDAATVSPQVINAFCRGRLAAFKVPRYLSYIDNIPKGISGKTAKIEMVEGVEDLRRGSFDWSVQAWI